MLLRIFNIISLILDMRKCDYVIFGSSVMTLNWEENLVAIFLSPKNEMQLKNTDIDWIYIAWNAWHAARFRLSAIPVISRAYPF